MPVIGNGEWNAPTERAVPMDVPVRRSICVAPPAPYGYGPGRWLAGSLNRVNRQMSLAGPGAVSGSSRAFTGGRGRRALGGPGHGDRVARRERPGHASAVGRT